MDQLHFAGKLPHLAVLVQVENFPREAQQSRSFFKGLDEVQGLAVELPLWHSLSIAHQAHAPIAPVPLATHGEQSVYAGQLLPAVTFTDSSCAFSIPRRLLLRILIPWLK
jgi:hypothetical protein